MTETPTKAAMKATARINQKYVQACSAFSNQEGVKDIGWYRCSTGDCDGEWDKNWIAHVVDKNEPETVTSRFKLLANGTLVFKLVLAEDDGKLFICQVRTPRGIYKTITIFIVARGRNGICTLFSGGKITGEKTLRARTRININSLVTSEVFSETLRLAVSCGLRYADKISSKAPQIILESSTTLHVVEGKELRLNVRVQGYPFPRVTWSHYRNILKETSNVHSETSLKIPNVKVSERGLYACYAENSIGNDSLIVNVYVEGQPRTKTTESDLPVRITTESDILPLSTSSPSAGSCFTGGDIATTALGVLVFTIVVILLIYTLKKKWRQRARPIRRCIFCR